jgi:hypothetical protein
MVYYQPGLFSRADLFFYGAGINDFRTSPVAEEYQVFVLDHGF